VSLAKDGEMLKMLGPEIILGLSKTGFAVLEDLEKSQGMSFEFVPRCPEEKLTVH